jgi:hypothetical protein
MLATDPEQQKDYFWVAVRVDDAAIRAVEISVDYLDAEGHELTLSQLAARPAVGSWTTAIFTFKRGALLRVQKVRVSLLETRATKSVDLER